MGKVILTIGVGRNFFRLGPATFGIFDAFPNEEGRQAHLTGQVAAALMAQASELLSQPPSIKKVEVLTAKLPA